MKTIKKIFKWIGILIGLFLLYVIVSIIHGTLTDYQPEEVVVIEPDMSAIETTIGDSSLTFITWNVGYGGLGAESEFFYDNGGFFTSKGKMVTAPKPNVEKNIKGANQFLKENNDTDFILLQEVDVNSKRSYYINQHNEYIQSLEGYAASFAPNFDVKRIPIPVLEPWNVIGKTYSGLGTYSKYQAKAIKRFQLPGAYGWPDRIFHLDRCAAVHRYPYKDGKEVVVVNAHNSAYDQGGVLKKQQMDYLKKFFLAEYNKGNYVIVGGDWNQCPPNFPYDTFSKENADDYSQINIKEDFLPGWKWGYDPKIPTNRKLTNPYKEGETFITLIDFFLVSPNVEIKDVKGIDQDFQFSDHQPVKMTINLN